jgi:hypothetical protein
LADWLGKFNNFGNKNKIEGYGIFCLSTSYILFDINQYRRAFYAVFLDNSTLYLYRFGKTNLQGLSL